MEHNVLFTQDGRSCLVLFPEDGLPSIVNETHPHYTKIAAGLKAGEDVSEWLDATVVPEVEAAPIEIIAANLSARVSVLNDVLHFDGDPVVNGLADTIRRYHVEGRDTTNLVRFMERLSTNPNPSSREQLFNWTEAQDLTIDRDGYIVGFKGVYSRPNDRDYLNDVGQPLFPLDKYPYMSSSAGHGIVDGIEITGQLPMGVGVTVEMPRTEVNSDPHQGCSTGLHVGTYDYAKGYSSGALLEVRFDPADVVSVPADCGFAKLRCCRYEGVAVHEWGGDLSAHEPEAAEDEAWNEFATAVPVKWRKRFMARLRRKDTSDE